MINRMDGIEEKYKKRVEKFDGLVSTMDKPLQQMWYSKSLLIIITLITLVVAYVKSSIVGGVFIFIVFVVLYVYLETKHKKILEFKENNKILKMINENAIKRFNNKWTNFKDDGSDFVVSKHSYAADLDITGKDSLFQWMTVCETPWGRKKLAKTLLFPEDTIIDLVAKQEAIGELGKKIKFRQRLQMETKKMNVSEVEFNKFLEWVKATHTLYLDKRFLYLVRVLPILTWITILLGPILNQISLAIPIILLISQSIMLFVNSSQRSHYLESIYKSNKSIKKLTNVLKLIEKYQAKSLYLKEIKLKFQMNDKDLPSEQVRKLSKIASNISNRGNMVYFIINVLFLWDFQSCVSLERWKAKSGQHVEQWIDIIGTLEALSSIALIRFDHATWCMPSFEGSSSGIYMKGTDIGHPLIGQSCVTNSVQFTKDNPIALITGSNMSGKSTFERTIGINLVLANIGAPVFAKDFTCMSMTLVTCMRVSDDLQQNISSFYGEILRVKMIVDKVKEGEKVFFLLDEIFKGTNSADRHTAAKTIIHNLNKHGATGMVSTHDLELDVLENESKGKVINYHFEEQYENERISFDYKLKEGVSTTRNAIYLIKAAGIDI